MTNPVENDPKMSTVFLKSNGNVRGLLVYKVATMISSLTEYFVATYIPRSSRTVDQMQQAARSCKQNIVEGSEAAVTSKETEIKLTNVARASLGELMDDYLDYLRSHRLPLWSESNHERLGRMRDYTRTARFSAEFDTLLPRLNPEELCNLAITLINQAQYLLRRMMERQQRRFLEEGGIREQMTRARMARRESGPAAENKSFRTGRSFRNGTPPTPPTNPNNPNDPTNDKSR